MKIYFLINNLLKRYEIDLKIIKLYNKNIFKEKYNVMQFYNTK